MTRRQRMGWFLGGGCWVAAVAAGFGLLYEYASRPGIAASAPPAWPAEISRSADEKNLLILFLHPRCPCSRATLDNLAELLPHVQGQLAVRIYFWEPEKAAADWTVTALWQTARVLPATRVFRDPGGLVARRFGATTSGQGLLYDPAGQLFWRGGLTAARGHAGESAGIRHLQAILKKEKLSLPIEAPVFGCPLFEESTAP
jgi:hypothetical protein